MLVGFQAAPLIVVVVVNSRIAYRSTFTEKLDKDRVLSVSPQNLGPKEIP